MGSGSPDGSAKDKTVSPGRFFRVTSSFSSFGGPWPRPGPTARSPGCWSHVSLASWDAGRSARLGLGGAVPVGVPPPGPSRLRRAAAGV